MGTESNFNKILTQPWHCFFYLLQKNHLKQLLLLTVWILAAFFAKAQKIDSIYVNLYTDSLKKGTYNYINVDGLLQNGRYLPLDSTHIAFEASAGRFVGNNLWIDKQFIDEKVHIKVTLRSNKALFKEFDIYIKKKADDEQLKSVQELLSEMQNASRQKRKGRN